MARSLTSTKFDALVQRVVRMADGISRHKSEEGFPKRLDDADLLAKRQQLEVSREQYEVLAKQAAQAYDGYAGLAATLVRELAQNDEAIRGFYGKANAVVAEFGTALLGTRGARKAKAKPEPQPQPAK